MNRLRLTATCLAVLALGALTARGAVLPAAAAVGTIVLAAAGVSLDQAVAMVQQRFNARVVRADVRDEGGHTIYVLRLLSESGRVWIVRVDAASGAIM
jgi:uncharacterized membrane protein YkoI